MNCFLRTNSQEIRDKLLSEGIECCPCAEFPEAEWLDFSEVSTKVHGIYPAEYPFDQQYFGTKDNFRELFLERNKDSTDCGEDVELFIKIIKDERDDKESEESR